MLSSRRTNVWFDRYAPILGLAITSAVCYTLFALHFSDYRGSEGLREWTRSQRVIVTIAVQLLSHVLGLIHVQIICALIKISFALSLRKRSFPLYWAQFIQTASTPRMSWDLPWRFCLLLSLVVASAFVPAAIWAPALAPLPAEKQVARNLNIPTFEVTNTSTLWIGDQSTVLNAQWMSSQGGLFSFDPAVTKSLMQTSSSDASVKTDGVYKHAKLDKTGFSYINRSQGAGSVAGFQQFENVKDPSWFTYQEDSFSSSVTCFYNNASWWTIQPVSRGSVIPNVYKTTGTTPSGNYGGAGAYLAWLDHDMFLWATSYQKLNQTIAVQFITLANKTDDQWGFSSLNRMQCNIGFKLRSYSVLVNTTSKLITTQSVYGTNRTWPSYGDAVITQVSDWMGAVSWLDSGCFGGCPLGRSIVGNVRQLQNVTGDASNATTLKAVEDYLGAMTDNVLVNLLLTRMASKAPQATKSISVTVAVPAVVFGDAKFIYIICGINVTITIVYLFECIRTRVWAEIPDFDISNTSNVLISALRGGMAFERSLEDSERSTLDESAITEFMRMRLVRDDVVPNSTLLMPLFGGRGEARHIVVGNDEESTLEKQAFLAERTVSRGYSPPPSNTSRDLR